MATERQRKRAEKAAQKEYKLKRTPTAMVAQAVSTVSPVIDMNESSPYYWAVMAKAGAAAEGRRLILEGDGVVHVTSLLPYDHHPVSPELIDAINRALKTPDDFKAVLEGTADRELSVAEKLIDAAMLADVVVHLDHPSDLGMIKYSTPRHAIDVAAGMSDVAPESLPLNKPVHHMLGAQLNNYRRELIRYLRAPYRPAAVAAPAGTPDPSKRNIYERIARPDNLVPGYEDNQNAVKRFLGGEHWEMLDAQKRSRELSQVLPFVITALPTT